MRVRAAGSPGVTTVNAVQTTVKRGKGGKGGAKGSVQREPKVPRSRGAAQRDKVEKRDQEGVGERQGGGHIINKEHRDAAGSD